MSKQKIPKTPFAQPLFGDTLQNEVLPNITNDENENLHNTMILKKTQDGSFDNIWCEKMVHYTRVVKDKDILPVVKHLITSLIWSKFSTMICYESENFIA